MTRTHYRITDSDNTDWPALQLDEFVSNNVSRRTYRTDNNGRHSFVKIENGLVLLTPGKVG